MFDFGVEFVVVLERCVFRDDKDLRKGTPHIASTTAGLIRVVVTIGWKCMTFTHPSSSKLASLLALASEQYYQYPIVLTGGFRPDGLRTKLEKHLLSSLMTPFQIHTLTTITPGMKSHEKRVI